MGWLGGYGDDQPDLSTARPGQLMQVRREALATADRYSRRAQSMLDPEWVDVTDEVRHRSRVGLKMARDFRRLARGWLKLSVALRSKPTAELRTAQLALDAMAAARAALERQGWTVDVPGIQERRFPVGLPPIHGPPPRQLTDVHAPFCGVPAPPISRRRTGVD